MKTTLRILATLLAVTGPAIAMETFAADTATAAPAQAPPAGSVQTPPAEAAPPAQHSPYPQAPQKRTWQGYDPATVETISGDVLKVDTIQRRGGRFSAIHLVVATHGGETIDVLLGPSSFLDKQPVRIGEKDKIEVTGSRITASSDGKPAIIAATVRKGDAVLKLREADGTPLWRRKGRCD